MLKPSSSTVGQISTSKSCTSAPGDMDVNIHNSSEQMAKNQKESQIPFNRRMNKYTGYLGKMKYYTERNLNEPQSHITEWVHFINVIPSVKKESKSLRTTYTMIPFF